MLLIVALELWSSDDNEVHSGSRRCATEAFFITTISSYSFYTLGHQSTFTAIPVGRTVTCKFVQIINIS